MGGLSVHIFIILLHYVRCIHIMASYLLIDIFICFVSNHTHTYLIIYIYPSSTYYYYRSDNLDERWARVQSQAQSYRVAGNNNDTTNTTTEQQQQQEQPQEENEDLLWQSAMDEFNQKQTTPSSPDDYPPTLSQLNQEQRDEEYAMRIQSQMDMMGSNLEPMEYEQSSPDLPQSSTEQYTHESLGKLTLWQTLKVLYKRNTMIKYYLLGLFILLAATCAIVVVVLLNQTSSTSCASASYSDTPSILLPDESQQTIRAGEFGTSISASNDYLIVGAPNVSCKSQEGTSCDDFSVGGAAYLYKLYNNEWSIYSSFILDDGVSSGDEFGKAVAIDKDSTTVVVGSPKDDNIGITSGAIYVFESPFSSSSKPLRLVSDDIGVKDDFGGSVSVSSTTIDSVRVTNIVAGASLDDGDSGSFSGAVYVFSKFDNEPPRSACGGDRNIEVGVWIQCQKLLPDDPSPNDQFGRAVDISDRTIVVGAMWDDDKGIDSGAAYVYSLGDDGSWSLQQKITPAKFKAQADRFGHSVSTSGNRIVVGADLDGDEDTGAAYLYKLERGAWQLESKLVHPEQERDFVCGFSVDISSNGETVIVGCPYTPSGGIAYMYQLIQNEKTNGWTQTEKFKAPDNFRSAGLQLGSSVAVTTRDDGMTIAGFGEFNGEIFSYRKNC